MKAWLVARLQRVFGLDTRSLAVSRILLALLVLSDIATRLTDYEAFYTEGGALPREAVLQHLSRRDYVSLQMASGADGWAAVCFALEAVAALALLVGYRTRLATFLTWLLLTGLHARASILLQSGDVVLRLLLFWACFLPMGARLSVDSLRALPVRAPPRQVVGVASFALQFQMAAIYIWTAMLKTGSAWKNGEAVYYALSIDHFAKQPFASLLLEQAWAWRGLTHATLWWEVVGPWLLLVPFFFGPVRVLTVAGFVLLHLGFWAGLEIGLFPWICIVGWLALLPGWLWDRLGWRIADGAPGDTWIGLPWARRAGRPWARGARYLATQVPVLFLVWMVFQWNMSTVDGRNWRVPGSVRWIGHTLRLDQDWEMFAPYPFKDDGWFVVPGELVGGGSVELFQGGAPAWASEAERATWTRVRGQGDEESEPAQRLSRQKPAVVSAMYKNQRWRKYMRNLWQKRHRKLRLYYGKYLCRAWNETHTGGEKLRRLDLVFMKEQTPPPGLHTEVVPVTLWSHDCFKPTQLQTTRDEDREAREEKKARKEARPAKPGKGAPRHERGVLPPRDEVDGPL